MQNTILLIEDDRDARALVVRALESEDYNVLEASNGPKAFEFLQANPCPDLVLLDLSMPEMDGDEFIERMRKLPECADVKVVLMSGWADLAKRCEELGAAGYIRKPLDLRGLSREIKKHLTD